jgi:hypothetical protein
VVPQGSTAGRAAAFAAGSRLTWVPLHGDVERWGADSLVGLLTPRSTGLGPSGGDRSDDESL